MKNNMDISRKYPEETDEEDANVWTMVPLLTVLGILLLAISAYGLAASLGLL